MSILLMPKAWVYEPIWMIDIVGFTQKMGPIFWCPQSQKKSQCVLLKSDFYILMWQMASAIHSNDLDNDGMKI